MTLASTRNPHLVKWDILFDKKIVEWISFKPQLGMCVYPCYACRDMFGSKNSFLDHVNRRALILKYKCNSCTTTEKLLFYNPCSFLLHARQHFNLVIGQINLDNLEIAVLPFGLGGFLPDPSIPLLYNVEEDDIGETLFINTRFYSPAQETMGFSIINLIPNEVLFLFVREQSASASLVLQQISSNIPKCKFVFIDSNRFNPVPIGFDVNGKALQKDNDTNNMPTLQIKEEPEDTEEVNQYEGPVITKIESVREPYSNYPSCPECHQVQNKPMGEHFLETNKPFEEELRCVICKYIAPTKCSLKAHERIHQGLAPFVCPECGKDFGNTESLHSHLEEVCFHLTKQVRLRCPGKKCGKVFAQIVTFSSHFAMHMKCLTKCVNCDKVFLNETEFYMHASNILNHVSIKVYTCTVCNEVFNESTFSAHIYEHATNKKQCVYVYICKYCRSYFRSTATYATHLLRCSKLIGQTHPRESLFLSDIQKRKYTLHVLGTCLKCNTQVKAQVHKLDNMPERCPNCNEPFNKKQQYALFVKTNELNQTQCVLCDKIVDYNEIDNHFNKQDCIYVKPIVRIEHIRIEHSSDSTRLESNRKKRRRPWTNSHNKQKSPNYDAVDTVIPEPEKPTPFDGTYYCKLCDYNSNSREEFHNHVIQHRRVSTAYQCMECGECFIVKPSLEKHLLYYHQVTDINDYFMENDCFDRKAVKELEDVMHLAPGETKEPVKENQCRVCLEQFNNGQDLSKHFRIHGMAFLMKNSK